MSVPKEGDRWRVVEQLPERGFRGHTELTRRGRTVTVYGSGREAVAAVLEKMEGSS